MLRFGIGRAVRLLGRPSWLSICIGFGDVGSAPGTVPTALVIGAEIGGCGRLSDALAVGAGVPGVPGVAAVSGAAVAGTAVAGAAVAG